MFCNPGFCHPDGSQLTALFLPPTNSSHSWARNLSQRSRKTEATSLDSGETGGGWSEAQCPSPAGSEAARESRWGAGAQSQCWCLCLHTAPPTTAQGCDSGRKPCSGLTWDMLGTGKIFCEEHIKGGLQRAVLSRVPTWPTKRVATTDTKARSCLHSIPHCVIRPQPSWKTLASFLTLKKNPPKMIVLSLLETDKLFYLALQNKIKKKKSA